METLSCKNINDKLIALEIFKISENKNKMSEEKTYEVWGADIQLSKAVLQWSFENDWHRPLPNDFTVAA